jgi:TM2 domain-containing membrane protein YozV
MIMKYCVSCGQAISENAKFCPHCGETYGSEKNKYTAGVLALFLGGFGVHHFYLEKPIIGIFYLLFCWTFIPALFSLIEALNFFTMGQETFNKRYK